MRGIVIPQLDTKPLRWVEGPDYRELAHAETNIREVERFNSQGLFDIYEGSPNLAFILDDEGVGSPDHAFNARAMVLSKYMGPGIFGDVILFGETTRDEIYFHSPPTDALERVMHRITYV